MDALDARLGEIVKGRALIRDQSIDLAERAILAQNDLRRMRVDAEDALGAICQADVMADADEAIAELTRPPLDKDEGGRGF
jgi:DNA replication initiation complex subunit (GINS family)